MIDHLKALGLILLALAILGGILAVGYFFGTVGLIYLGGGVGFAVMYVSALGLVRLDKPRGDE